MNTIVPDKVLDEMICSECSKYLSVLPVRAYPNRDTKCGRCIEEDDNGAPSQVNKVIPTMLFKCYNRYEGCTSLLLPDQVEEHEKSCISKNFHTCPLCSDSNMPPYLMLAHFKKYHGCYLLKRPVVQINGTIDSDKYYLYCSENMIFMLNISVDTVSSKIFLDSKLVGPEELAKEISQQFCVKEGSFFMNSEFQPYDTFMKKRFEFSMGQLETLDIICELILRFDVVQFSKFQVKKNDKLSMINKCYTNKLYLSPTIKKAFPGCKLSTCGMSIINTDGTNILHNYFCLFCKKELYLKQYFCYAKCPKPTVFCGFCKNKRKVSEKCPNGHDLTGYIIRHNEYLNLEVFCKWKCGEHFNSLDLYEHEQNCVYREPITMCPVPNCTIENFKNFSELQNHFKTHKNTILMPYWDSNYWAGNLKENDYYVFMEHITVVFCNNNEKIKLKNIITSDKTKFKIFVNKTQIALNEEIEKPKWDIPLKFRIFEDFIVECK
ncbi:unnamed protein product [Brassicogethes aeneus]|uniref:E3 ubiquitin-protein ligase n=1 Tax=Brassicogethes aeneus TaxID=1431903 RepID=A0A9P0ASY3_BRAAE|nr:unnamed protein product [Brassicogethes aeneus]